MSGSIENLRSALKAACPDGKTIVTVPQLMEMLGLSGDSQYTLTRRRLHDLEKQGEAKRVGNGKWLWTCNEPLRRGVGYQRMWRAIRTSNGSFTSLDIVQISRADRSFVSKYLRHLEDVGLVRRYSKDGNTLLYCLTSAGREHRETPYPPRDIQDPFYAERAATAALCRILLVEDVQQPRVVRKIQEQLKILNNRFSEGANYAEQQN